MAATQDVTSATSVIPAMTRKLSRHWDQPSRETIILDDKRAWLPRATWKALAGYDCSMPSGVYEGKMWRRDETQFHRNGRRLLCWYGPSPDPDCCSIQVREVVIAEAIVLKAILALIEVFIPS